MSKVIAQIEIQVTGTVTIDLTTNDIKKIVEEADGDYEGYIEDMGWSRYDIDDVDVDERNYSKSAVESAIADFLKKNPEKKTSKMEYVTSAGKFLHNAIANREDFMLDTKNLQEVKIDREILKLVYECADEFHPKIELRSVYFDATNMVATDARRLMVIPHSTELNDVLIPKAFCEAYCNDAEAKIYVDKVELPYKVFLSANDKYYAWNMWGSSRFPNYNRIIPKELEHTLTHEEFVENSYDVSIFDNEKITAVYHNDTYIFIDTDFIPKGRELSFKYNEAKLPLVFQDEKITYVCMPIYVEKTDAVYKLAVEKVESKNDRV